MGEILFKGKRTDNGEWVYGYLIKLGKGFFTENERYGIVKKAIPILNSEDCFSIHIVEVIPETIGRYTGLTDKNDNKIFEGDVVKTQPFTDRPYSKKSEE